MSRKTQIMVIQKNASGHVLESTMASTTVTTNISTSRDRDQTMRVVRLPLESRNGWFRCIICVVVSSGKF